MPPRASGSKPSIVSKVCVWFGACGLFFFFFFFFPLSPPFLFPVPRYQYLHDPVFPKPAVKDAFATFPMIQHAMANMANSDFRKFSMHSTHNLMLATDARPKPELCKS